MERKSQFESIRVTGTQAHRLRAYKKRTGIGRGQILRLLLELPWDNDDIEPVILKLPKAETASQEQLRAWLAVACADIEKHYFPEG